MQKKDSSLAADLAEILPHLSPLKKDLDGAHIFLTGGTGFFGCWLLESITYAIDHLPLQCHITVLTRQPEAFQKKAPHLASHPSITLLQGDVRSFSIPEGHFTHIIHGATDADETLNQEEPELMYDTIVEGTKRVLQLAKISGAKRSLLISSGAVYGTQPPTITHMTEDEALTQKPLEQPSAYAKGKREAERLWREQNGGPIARCYAFVGPYLPLDRHFAIGNFIRDAAKGGTIEVQGDGTPRRSYLYAADLAIWLWTILCKGEKGEAYNVGSEDDRSVEEIARLVAECSKPPVPVTIAKKPVPGAQPQRYIPSTEKARSELRLEQSIALEDAIARTLLWYSYHPDSPGHL